MIWLKEILKIHQEEQLPIKYCMIKPLILLKIQNMDIKKVLHLWFKQFLIKHPKVVVSNLLLKMKLNEMNN